MKHIQKFKSFSINEGLSSDIKSTLLKDPKISSLIDKLSEEISELSPSYKSKLKSISRMDPEDLKEKIEDLVPSNEGIKDFFSKKMIGKILTILGISQVSLGFITTLSSIIKIVVDNYEHTRFLGHSAANVGAVGMFVMLASLIPWLIGVALDKSEK